MSNIFQKVFAQAKRHSDISSISLENQDPNIISFDKNQIKAQSVKMKPLNFNAKVKNEITNEKPTLKVQITQNRPNNNNNNKNQIQNIPQAKPKSQRSNNYPTRSISVPKTRKDIQYINNINNNIKSDFSKIPRIQKNKKEDPILKQKETLRQLEAIEVELSNAANILDQAEKELEAEKARHSFLESKKAELELTQQKLLDAAKACQEKVANKKEENQLELQKLDEFWQFKIRELETLIECARSTPELETL